MEKRGANPSLPHRLVWVGTPRPAHQHLVPSHQFSVCPNRLEMVDDAVLQHKLPFLAKGFQFDTPLRIEPDFTLQQSEMLHIAEELPVLSTPSTLSEKPRALVGQVVQSIGYIKCFFSLSQYFIKTEIVSSLAPHFLLLPL